MKTIKLTLKTDEIKNLGINMFSRDDIVIYTDNHTDTSYIVCKDFVAEYLMKNQLLNIQCEVSIGKNLPPIESGMTTSRPKT